MELIIKKFFQFLEAVDPYFWDDRNEMCEDYSEDEVDEMFSSHIRENPQIYVHDIRMILNENTDGTIDTETRELGEWLIEKISEIESKK